MTAPHPLRPYGARSASGAGGGAPARGHGMGAPEHAAWVVAEHLDEMDDVAHAAPTDIEARNKTILRRYHLLRRYSYEKAGIDLRLPLGLVHAVGKLTGAHCITLMLLLPYLAGLLTEQQTRKHIKAEVWRRNRWVRSGGYRRIRDPADTKWERRDEVLEYHRDYAERHGWTFPTITVNPDLLVDDLVEDAVADHHNLAAHVGSRNFTLLMIDVARQRGQYVEMGRNSNLAATLYPIYLRRLQQRLDLLGLPTDQIESSLRLLGNENRKRGDDAVTRLAPQSGLEVPASGSGRAKGDLVVGRFLIEVKHVRTGRYRLRGADLHKIEKHGLREGRIPILVLDFGISSRNGLVALVRAEDSTRSTPDAPLQRAMAGQKNLSLEVGHYRDLAKGNGHEIALDAGEGIRRYLLVETSDLEVRTLELLLEPAERARDASNALHGQERVR